MANHPNRISIPRAWQDGRDYVRAELTRMAARGSAPYGASALVSGTFAAACYDGNTLADLDLSRARASDAGDRAAWGLTARQWAEQIGMAYEAMLWDQQQASA